MFHMFGMFHDLARFNSDENPFQNFLHYYQNVICGERQLHLMVPKSDGEGVKVFTSQGVVNNIIYERLKH